MNELESIFTKIYSSATWAMGQNDSKSGLGSSNSWTIFIRKYLTQVIKEKNIKSMIDTSCGDWFWMKTIKDLLPFYLGIDIVQPIIIENKNLYENDKIKFLHSDFLSYLKTLPDKSVDLVLCRHTCEHLPTAYNLEFIEEVKRVSTYLLLTTHLTSTVNKNLQIPQESYRPINLNLEPYVSELNNYYVESHYDGPIENFCPEMFIHLYRF
jgi:ubiquinone/menaquinone biosynthesis C-methylase UbiE